jgi:hypothetical protein
MSRRTDLFAAVATIGLSAVCTWVTSTPANAAGTRVVVAAGTRVVVNAKMKNASPLRPNDVGGTITRFGWKSQNKTLQ